ncbi:MAG: hypothetical protein IJK56_04205 [Firmicutes bacterium]|nr:hypothetical protein [Bacillota bacterium]
MKRIMLLLFCCVVVLCACGKNEKVKSVEDLISKIGVVSFSSKESIDAAKNAYDTLSATEQKQVENYHILEEAQKAYDALGIQITLENYSKYLNVNIDTYLSDGMDLGQWVGIGKTVNDTVYTSIKSVVTISGKSNNYDYNDITVRVKFTGNYGTLSVQKNGIA